MHALVLAAAVLIASPQAPCTSHAEMVKQLLSKYKETPFLTSINNYGQLMEVFTAPYGASWSIVVTSPQGLACLMSAGGQAEQQKELKEGNPI